VTRKHFQALADALKWARPENGWEHPAPSPYVAQWQADIRAVGDACYAANGRFDRGRFERACGMDGRS